MDVVAPSVNIRTTDITGNNGYTDMDYYGGFYGTSSACPHVSGVATLVLSVAPELTVEEVATVIESSARKVREDLYVYQSDTMHISGTWNNEVGYGLIDAAAAVDIAKKKAETICIRDQVFDNSSLERYYEGINVEIENVTVEPRGVLEIAKEKTAILRSSVRVKKHGFL